MAIYVLSVALSLPGGLILTVAGGLLFGSLIGGLAAVVGGDRGRHHRVSSSPAPL